MSTFEEQRATLLKYLPEGLMPESEFEELKDISRLIGSSITASMAGLVPTEDTATLVVRCLEAAREMGRRSSHKEVV